MFCFASIGDEAPTYANVQRWSKRFRDAIDSPLASPLGSQVNFETQDYQLNQEINANNLNEENHDYQIQRQINANAKKSYSTHKTVKYNHRVNKFFFSLF